MLRFSCRLKLVPLALRLKLALLVGIAKSCSSGLFQLQMRISFPFLLATDIHRFLVIMRTRSFFSSLLYRRYIRKVSVHLMQKYFHMIAVMIVYPVDND